MNVGTLTIEMAANVARLQKDMQRATRTVDGAMTQIRRSADMATRALGGLVAAIGAREVINAIDSYTRFNAQLKLATRSTEEFTRAQAYVTAIAKESYRDLNSIGVLYARIANSTRELGISQERVVNITRSVALAMQVSGASANESASAMLQLSQAFASGVLRGEEFNAVNEAAPRLMKALADGLGVPIGSLRELAQNGQITSAILADTLPKALQELIKESKEIQTISGSFQQLKNEVLLFVGATGEAGGVTAGFAAVLSDLAAILSAFNSETTKAGANSEALKIVIEGLAITFETLAVLGVNVAYVFEMVAREVVGIGKQIQALATGNLKGFNAIGDQMKAFAEQRRMEVDALTERILNARKLAEQARKDAQAGNDILSQAAALNDNFKASSLGAAKAAADAKKEYDKLIETLKEANIKGVAELQAEQQNLNKAQQEFLEIVSSPSWNQYTEQQRLLVTDLYKQRIETEKLVEAEKKRKKEAEKRLKQMEDDYQEMLEFINEEDRKAEEKRLKALEDMYAEHKRQIEKIGDQLTDALMRAFESGKGFGQAFKDTLVNMFRTMVLRPILAPISGAFAGAFGGTAMAAGPAGMTGTTGFLGGLAVASASVGTGIAAGFTNALSLNFAGSLQAAGSLIGTGALSGIAAGVGMIAGTLLPIVGAVSLIKSLTGGDGKDPTGMGAFVTTRGVDINRELVAATTGFKISSNVVGDFFDRANEQLKPAVQTIVDTILDRTQARARAIGIDIALGIDAGLVADPAARSSFGYASVFLGDQEVENFVNRKLGPDFEQATIKFTEQLQESIAKAVLDAGNIVIPAGQTATAVLERLGSSILAVNSTFDTLGLSMFQTSIAGAEMAANLVDLLGGVESFTMLSAQYYQEFYTEAERVEILTRQLTSQFGELGLELPATREAFRDLVEAQDLTTESGREMFAALMQLNPAFASISPSLDLIVEAVDDLNQSVLVSEAILQERISLEDRLLRLQGDTDALRERERNSLDESNRALLDRIFVLEDEIQAREDATRAAQEYADELQSQFQEAQNVTNQALEAVRRSIQSEIERYQQAAGATDSAFARLQRSVEASARKAEESITKTYNALNDALNLQLQSAATAKSVAQENVSALQSVFDLLKSNIEDLMTDILPQMTVAQGRVFLAQALTTAQSTGYLPEREQLSSAISAVRSGLTPEAFGSSFEMRREQLRLVVQLQSLQNLTGNQLSTAELQLKAADEQVLLLERRIEDAKIQFDLDLQQNRDYYDSILRSAQDQIDATRGVDKSIVSVNEAINLLETAIQAEEYATAQIEILEQQLNTAEQQVNALRRIDNSIISLGSAIISLSSAVRAEARASTAAALAAERARVASAATTSEFAAGGLHTGGMRLVGERGPELEITGPARYMSNATLASMMNSGNNEEIKQMREENKVQMRAMVSLQNRMTKIIEQWNGDGLPTERVEA